MESTDQIKTEQMDSDEMESDWFGYECKSGDILFYYNIKTGEHRWRKHLSCSENTIPKVSVSDVDPKPNEQCSVATQTEDFGCINQCTSKYVDNEKEMQNRKTEINERKDEAYTDDMTDVNQSNIINNFVDENLDEVSEDIGMDEELDVPYTNTNNTTSRDPPQNDLETHVLQRDSDDEEENDQSDDKEIVNIEDVDVSLFTVHDVHNRAMLSRDPQAIVTNIVEGHESNEVNDCDNQPRDDIVVNPTTLTNIGAKWTHVTKKRKQIVCSFCEKKFKKRKTLSSHIARIHSESERSCETGIVDDDCKNTDGSTSGGCVKDKEKEVNSISEREVQNTASTITTDIEDKTTKKKEGNTKWDHVVRLKSLPLEAHVKPHGCPHCNSRFQYKSVLNFHLRTHTGEKPYECPSCGKAFAHESNLIRHVRTHTGEKPYECPSCGKAFTQKGQLKVHLRTHTGEKPCECPSCGKAFAYKNVLVLHLRTHTGEKPCECPSCGKAFSYKNVLVRHLRTHTGEKPYECSSCGKAFTQKRQLKVHLRTHTGENPYECPSCGKAFAYKNVLVLHLRTHTGEKPYECPSCGKAFTQKTHLDVHLRTHTGEKPYECSSCSKAFARKHHLDVHLRKHTGEKPYECSSCGKAFASESVLVRHLRTHNGEKPYEYSSCSKAKKGNLAYHPRKRAV